MDLRFEAAANEYYENTKNDAGFKVPKFIGIIQGRGANFRLDKV